MRNAEPWDVVDPARVLTDVLRRVAAEPDAVLVAMLGTGERQEVVNVTQIQVGAPLGRHDVSELLRRHARSMAGDRPWEGSGWRRPQFLFVTVVPAWPGHPLGTGLLLVDGLAVQQSLQQRLRRRRLSRHRARMDWMPGPASWCCAPRRRRHSRFSPRNLLHKAQRALDDDSERARAYVTRAVQLPFDEAEVVVPVA